MPVTGVGGAASEECGTDRDAEADWAAAVAASATVPFFAAAEARGRLLEIFSVLVDDIFASAAFLFLVVGGILAVGGG